MRNDSYNFTSEASLLAFSDAGAFLILHRTRQSVFAGIQDGYDEFFIWMKGFSMRPGLPSSKADLDSKQLISKLKKTKTCSF